MMVEVPWEMIQKVKMQELWFLHSACPLMLVDICMKFHDASLYGLKVIERTRWRQDFEGQSSKGNSSKNINARVTVLALCMSSNAG